MTAAAPGSRLRVALLTREYPPEVYGGAGVHGRERAVAEFGWQAVAAQTAALYAELAR